ncbi:MULTISPECIES: hypothetical protein [unclassified Methanothermobacter]|jgi:hypothetical protein|uniref:Uncharacterized protein n=1 Tax=Methanothermobacter thermautotrophicus TaxID=145262 RepID=A0A7J4MVX8_METTF|nr:MULTISPECIES: hypothetical protein [unclassified Methanothermobacter]MDN5373237.1 hypothetical protein [Methanothermobacter sp.]BAZ99643.1 hypothetical protein tca_01597 [Methanothermobacter sp. EMTCatA1]HIH64858.1 hypothetical protein [Methanothermobacter thermautotrophicus]HIH71015.1 hypothetical protein [Methanothermobacter thermautotrophicus]
MENKPIIISLLIAFIITTIISLTRYMEGTGLMPPKSAISSWIILLDIFVVGMTLGLIEAILGWMKGKGTYVHINIRKSPEKLLISVLVTVGFNFLGLLISLTSKVPLEESIFTTTMIGFMVVALMCLLYSTMIIRQAPA